MSKADEIYQAILDDVCKELDRYTFSSREELHEEVLSMCDDYTMDVENVFSDIEEEYADEKGLEWEEDE